MTGTQSQVRTREEGRKRRARILDQAQRIISERGYNGFGIQELAECCGLTKPGLLHHFGSKEQILLELLRDRDARSEAAIADALTQGNGLQVGGETPRDRFIRGMRAVVERDIAQPELTRLHAILRAEALSPHHPAHRYFTARAQAKHAAVSEGVETLSPDPCSTARQVLAMMAGLTEQWFREEQEFSLLDEFDRAIQLILPLSR